MYRFNCLVISQIRHNIICSMVWNAKPLLVALFIATSSYGQWPRPGMPLMLTSSYRHAGMMPRNSGDRKTLAASHAPGDVCVPRSANVS